MGRVTLLPFLFAGLAIATFSSCEAATVHLTPILDRAPDDVVEGMRFLGDHEDFTIYRAQTGVVDPEPMYVAVRRDSRELGAYFRAGYAQCWTKIGIVPCELPKETGLAQVPTPVTAWSVLPPGALPPTLAQKPPLPGHPWHPGWPGRPGHPGKPGEPGEPGEPFEPPVEPPVEPPQPAPIPLPPSGVLMLLVLFGLIFRKLLRFSGEYESLRAQCCNDPDYKGT